MRKDKMVGSICKLNSLIFLLVMLHLISCSNKFIQIPLAIAEDNEGRDIATWLKNDTLLKSQTLKLSNGVLVDRYVFDYFNIFDCCPNLPDTKMGILMATNDSNTFYIVPDRNFDRNFTNDSVFVNVLPDSILGRKEFKNLFPEVKIIVNKDDFNFARNMTVSFQVYPDFYDQRFFSEKPNTRRYKQVSYRFVNHIVFKGSAKKDESLGFQIRFNNRFSLQDQGSFYSTEQLTPFTFIVTKNKYPKDSVIHLAIYSAQGNSYLNNDSTIFFGKRKYYLREFSFQKKRLIFEKYNFKAENSKALKSNVMLVNTITEENETISFYDTARQKKLLLFFTGSWCAPCSIVLRDLKMINDVKKDQYKIVVIQKESSIINAKKYLDDNNIVWPCYFEPLTCLEPTCIERVFQINAYPTVIFINSKGKLCSKIEGVDAVQKLIKS